MAKGQGNLAQPRGGGGFDHLQKICSLSVLPASRCMLPALSQHFIHLAPAPIIDSLTFVMLLHSTTRPILARSDHQQALFNSDTPTLPLSGSLRQPSTTSTAFGSPCTLQAFRQPLAAPDNHASLSTAPGSLCSLQQPSAVSADHHSSPSFTLILTQAQHFDAPTRFPMAHRTARFAPLLGCYKLHT